MEFSARKTPKLSSSSGLRHNPYATGGKTYLSTFQRKAEKGNVTPPLKSSVIKNRSSEPKKFKPRSLIQSNYVLQNSNKFQNKESSKENIDTSNWASKLNGFESPKSLSKRPFKSLNYKPLDTSVDPHNVFSDHESDDDIFLSSKHSKLSNIDKENNNIPSPKVSSPKSNSVNPFKKKKSSVNLLKSNIVHDVSPEKLAKSVEGDKLIVKNEAEKEKIVFKFKSFAEKENATSPKEFKETKPVIEHPHMVGFPNFGNTCYLNAVLQTMANLHPFIADLSYLLEDVTLSETSLTCSLWNIIVARNRMDWLAIKNSLRSIKENVEKIDGSFSGFKMQDANEFLTQVLDTMKDEVDKSFALQAEKIKQYTQSPGVTRETCSALTSTTSSNGIEANSTSDSESPKTPQKNGSIFDTPSSSSPLSLETAQKKSDVLSDDELELISFKQPESTDNVNNSQSILEESAATVIGAQNGFSDEVINPVTNNFEFELFESYRCLGCSETEGKKQKHLALYVNLPTEDRRSIQEAVESYMGEDQRELTCEKCGHGKASFITSFVNLPRILIVQMKRYEYKPEQLECIKVSSKVNVNMWLHLDNLVTEDAALPPSYLEKPIRFSSKRELKPNTLSVRNLASEMNICSNGASEQVVSTPEKKPVEEVDNQEQDMNQEDKELQEVLLKSMEEISGSDETQKMEADPSKEEEEFQRAIRLSLQDMGMGMMNYEESNNNEDDTEETREEESEQRGKHSYRLLSIISHFGLTTCTGHYVSDILNCGEQQWYHYDDEAVNPLSESVVTAEGRQKNGYIFFYIHQDIFNNLTST